MSDRIPFPMPEPQRAAAVVIIVEVAAAVSVPPAFIVAHMADSKKLTVVYAARKLALRRIIDEVPGVTRGMVARAFRRDLRRVRASELNAERIHGDAGVGKPRETLSPLDDASC